MNTWKAISYIFLGIGTVLLIYAAIAFFSMMPITSQIPYVGQILGSVALAAVSPHLITVAIMYVIGGVSYYAGRENTATQLISSDEAGITAHDILDRLERLEGIVDNNFSIVTQRLDEMEEKQNMASQNTIIRARIETEISVSYCILWGRLHGW